MLDALLGRARQAVELAKEEGAADAFAFSSRSRQVEFRVRDGELEEVKESTSRSLSIQLYVDGRYSSHSTTDLRPEQVKSFVREAVALTRALQEDPHRSIVDPALFADKPDADLQIVDQAVTSITRDQRLKWCEDQNATLVGKDKVISATSGTQDSQNHGAAVSSNGFEGTWESTSVWMGSEVTLDGEGERRPEGWMWAGGRHLQDLPAPVDVAAVALARATSRLGFEQGPTARTTMVVAPEAGGGLVGRLLRPAYGRSVQQGRSFWADRLGKKVISDKLVIHDDPLLPRGLGSRYFDGEGISAQVLPILEGGALQNLYIDTYYGKKLGMAPTTGSPSNRVVKPGDKSLEELLKEAGSGIYVTSWLGGNADSTTGDFSLGMQGHLIENGEIGEPVGEMNVTGNLLELFTQLVAVGNDPWPYARLRTPTLVFDGVQFSGA